MAATGRGETVPFEEVRAWSNKGNASGGRASGGCSVRLRICSESPNISRNTASPDGAPLSEPERRDFWEICEDCYQVRS